MTCGGYISAMTRLKWSIEAIQIIWTGTRMYFWWILLKIVTWFVASLEISIKCHIFCFQLIVHSYILITWTRALFQSTIRLKKVAEDLCSYSLTWINMLPVVLASQSPLLVFPLLYLVAVSLSSSCLFLFGKWGHGERVDFWSVPCPGNIFYVAIENILEVRRKS